MLWIEFGPQDSSEGPQGFMSPQDMLEAAGFPTETQEEEVAPPPPHGPTPSGYEDPPPPPSS
eukprot:11402371-Karenia_brevis.AAC.1